MVCDWFNSLGVRQEIFLDSHEELNHCLKTVSVFDEPVILRLKRYLMHLNLRREVNNEG